MVLFGLNPEAPMRKRAIPDKKPWRQPLPVDPSGRLGLGGGACAVRISHWLDRRAAASRPADGQSAMDTSSMPQRSEERVLFAREFAMPAPHRTRPVGAKFSRRRNLRNLAPKTLKSFARLSTLHVWSDETEARRRHVIASRETAAERRACCTSLLLRFARNDGVPQRAGLGVTPIAAARLNSRTQ